MVSDSQYRQSAQTFVTIAFLVSALAVLAACAAGPAATPTGTFKMDSDKEVMLVQITVQVSDEVASALLQDSPPTARSEALARVLEPFGLTLEPLHPETADPTLRSYFTVAAADPATAQRVIDQLLQSGAVEAAYVKPPDEAP
jgi:hypothetical protein